jgi:hypothetical protein
MSREEELRRGREIGERNERLAVLAKWEQQKKIIMLTCQADQIVIKLGNANLCFPARDFPSETALAQIALAISAGIVCEGATEVEPPSLENDHSYRDKHVIRWSEL